MDNRFSSRLISANRKLEFLRLLRMTFQGGGYCDLPDRAGQPKYARLELGRPDRSPLWLTSGWALQRREPPDLSTGISPRPPAQDKRNLPHDRTWRGHRLVHRKL